MKNTKLKFVNVFDCYFVGCFVADFEEDELDQDAVWIPVSKT